MSRRGSQSPIRNSTPVNIMNSQYGQYQNNTRQSFNQPIRNSGIGGMGSTQLRQSTVPAQNVNSRYVYQSNQPELVGHNQLPHHHHSVVQQPELVGHNQLPHHHHSVVQQQQLVGHNQLPHHHHSVVQQPQLVEINQLPHQHISVVQQPSVVQKEIIYQQEPIVEYIQQEPEVYEKIVQVKGPSQIQYIDQAPQIVEKIIQIQEPAQIREIIKEIFVPQIQIEEKIVEVERPYEVIQWKDVPGEVETQIKHVEKPMEVISYQEGEPRYVEEIVEIPIHTTKQILHEVEVYHEQIQEEVDRTEIDRLNQEIEDLKFKCEKQNIDWTIAVDEDHSAIIRHPDTQFALQKSAAMYQNQTSSQAVKQSPYREEVVVKGGYNRNKSQNNSRLNFDANYGQKSQQRSQQNNNQQYHPEDNHNNHDQKKEDTEKFDENNYHDMLSKFGLHQDNVESVNKVTQNNTSSLAKNTMSRSTKQVHCFQNSQDDDPKREY